MSAVSLYDKYGGFASVSAVVNAFYERVRESDTLAPYFAHVDMAKLIQHQIAFLCKVLGGPDNYNGRALAAAHAKRGITSEAFDEVAMLLKESLEEAGVEPDDVVTILGVVASVKGDIVEAKERSSASAAE